MQPIETLNTEEAMLQKHVTGVMAARNEIIRRDAEATIATCLRYNTRPGMNQVPGIGSSIDIVQSGQWVPGWRMAGMLGPNVVAEQDNRF